jgi:hypothetical protein
MKGFLRYGSNNWLSKEISDKFMLELFSVEHQGFYKGYLLSTGERYETAKSTIKAGNGYRTEEEL